MPILHFSRRAGAGAVLALTLSCARDATAPERASLQVAPRGSAYDTRPEGGVGEDAVAFEEFTTGAIHGQYDWQSTGGEGSGTAPRTACAVYDHVIADNSALPPEAYAPTQFGRRSLRISNAVTTGCYSDQTFSQRAANVAGETGATSRSSDGATDYALAGARRENRFDAEFMVASTRPGAWQPGLEFVASPARGDDHRMSWVQVADWPDGLAVVFAERADPASPGAFQRTVVVRGLDRGTAHAIRLTVDFVDGPNNDEARVYVNGVLRHMGGSWETYYRDDAIGNPNFNGATPAVNRWMFRTGSDLRRGVLGDPAPSTRGFGFLIDAVRVSAYSVVRSADDCKDDGWRALRNRDGGAFGNQGECVSEARRDGHDASTPGESSPPGP